jgi:hypothetical protein
VLLQTPERVSIVLGAGDSYPSGNSGFRLNSLVQVKTQRSRKAGFCPAPQPAAGRVGFKVGIEAVFIQQDDEGFEDKRYLAGSSFDASKVFFKSFLVSSKPLRKADGIC